MKITYTVMRDYDDVATPFITTEDFENAYDTAHEYVYGMGGVTYLVEKHDGKTVKVTKFEEGEPDWEGSEGLGFLVNVTEIK